MRYFIVVFSKSTLQVQLDGDNWTWIILVYLSRKYTVCKHTEHILLVEQRSNIIVSWLNILIFICRSSSILNRLNNWKYLHCREWPATADLYNATYRNIYVRMSHPEWDGHDVIPLPWSYINLLQAINVP